MRILICCALLLALAVPVGAGAQDAQSLFQRAYNAKVGGDLAGAKQLFEQGLQLDPNNAHAQQFLGEVNATLANAQSLFARGYNAKVAGDLRGAQQLFEQGLQLDPHNANGQHFLAEVRAALAGQAPARPIVAAPAPPPEKEKGPKDFCADRPNFISRGICERRECEKPTNAKDPYCEPYRR